MISVTHAFVATATPTPGSHAAGKPITDDWNAAHLGLEGVMVLSGLIDASSNPNYPAADKGHLYVIIDSGKIGGASGPNVVAGETIICKTDSTPAGTQAAVGGYWTGTLAGLGRRDVTDVVDLTSADIAAIGSSPPEIVADPGANKTVWFKGAAAQVFPGTIPFTFNASSMAIFYTGKTSQLNDTALVIGNGGDDTFSTNGATDKALPRADSAHRGLSLADGSDDETGAIATATLNAAGLGYAPLDTFSIADGIGFNNAVGRVDTVGALGVVTAFTITTPGSFYETATGADTTALTGAGTGLKVNITAITPANGTARIWVTYQIVDLP